MLLSVSFHYIIKTIFTELDILECVIIYFIILFGVITILFFIDGLFFHLNIYTFGIFVIITLLFTKFYIKSKDHPYSISFASVKVLNHGYFFISLTFLFLIVSFCTIFALISPPPPWDSFVYHLTFPYSWIKNGDINYITVPFGDQAGTYFPSNTEILYAFVLMFLKQDFATNVLEMIFLILSSITIYLICIRLKIREYASFLGASLVFFTPYILHQTISSEVDIVFSFYFTATVYLLLRSAENTSDKKYFYLSLITAGLFLGTKSISLLFFSFMLLPIIIYIIYIRRNLYDVFISIILLCLFGGYWYVRNFILAGNPIFPLTVGIGGHTIFDGAYTRETMLNSKFHTDSVLNWLKMLIEGIGLPFFLIFVFSTFFNIRKKQFRLYIFIIAAILLICCFLIPYNKEIRFTYIAVFLLCILSANFVDKIIKSDFLKTLFYLVICISNISYSYFYTDDKVFLSLFRSISLIIKGGSEPIEFMRLSFMLFALPSALMLLYYILCFSKAFTKIEKRFSIIFITTLFIIGFTYTAISYPKYQYSYYSGFPLGRSWAFLHSTFPTPLNIAFTGTDINYGLSGPNMKNNFFYIPTTSYNADLFHECLRILKERNEYTIPKTDRIDFCRREPNYRKWLRRMSDHQPDILFVSVLHQNDLPHLSHDSEGFPIEREWADKNPEIFKLIYRNEQVRIYGVNKKYLSNYIKE